MKRNRISLPYIKKIKPLVFWRECRFCRKEFKKEFGFKIIDKKACFGIGENRVFESYCCSECAKDANEVKKLIEERKLEFIFNKPKGLKNR